MSQRLRALEAQVGTVLIVRSRPLRPTAAGQLLLKHTRQLRLLRADLERDLSELAPSCAGGDREDERISIAINADSIATWALRALDDLARQGLPLEIIADDQDFTHEWLREGQVLGCVTTLKQALRGCKVVPLGAMRLRGRRHAGVRCRRAARTASRRTTSASCPSWPSTARTTCRPNSWRGPSACAGWRCVSCSCPAPKGRCGRCCADWGVSVVPELLVRGLMEQCQLVDVAPGHRLADPALLALLEPAVRSAGRADRRPADHGRRRPRPGLRCGARLAGGQDRAVARK